MSGAGQPRLERRIGPLGSALLSFNGIVGAGIFALPAALHAEFGTFSPWLFPIFGSLILLVALPFANLAALFSSSGGPVAYTACFGRIVSFQVGWVYYLARLTAFAANANVFATYAAALWPPLGSTVGRGAVILALISLVTWVNVVGLKRAIRALDVLSLFKALPLVALAIGALAMSGEVKLAGEVPQFGTLEAAALMTLYAFVGFENSVVPAGETKDPKRTIPRMLIATVAATALLYFVVQLAYVSVMPEGAEPEAPLAELASILVGPVGIILLSLTAMASVGGNFLGSMTSTPRVTYALAEDGLIPSWFARVNAKWRTPVNSVLFMGFAGAALALSGSFVWLALVSTLARLFVYGTSIAALPAARRSDGRPATPVTWLLILGGLAICAWAAAQSELRSWLMLGGLLAVGAVLYAIEAPTRRRR
ncbi:MAG: APC family permease [Alphaproteobacteria bacterium]